MHDQSWRKRLVYRGAILLAACLLGVMALAQTGCTTSLAEWYHNGFKVGPNYHKPPVYVAQDWIEFSGKNVNPNVVRGDPDLRAWWTIFDDNRLDLLMHNSYSRNLSLRAAGYRVMQARANLAITLGQLLPQSQFLDASYVRREISGNLGSSGIGGDFNRFSSTWATNLNLSWELDFWGLFRRAVESADATLDASVEDYDNMLVILLSNVAQQYVQFRTFQKRIFLARANVAAQKPIVEKRVKPRTDIGKDPMPAYWNIKSSLDQTRSLIPPLEASLRLANDQLCVLLGMPPHDLDPGWEERIEPVMKEIEKAALEKDATLKVNVDDYVRIPLPHRTTGPDGEEMFEKVVLGIPGQLLLRRPDVQKAEREVKAQSAQIGIAEAEMYPHISINGSIGLAANKLGKLFNTKSWQGEIGPSLTWNILNYGRLLANVRLQDARFQELVATYQNTILTANQEAEDALEAYLQALIQVKDLQAAAVNATKTVQYYRTQINNEKWTIDTINALYTVQNTQVQLQDAAAQAEGNISLFLIQLYKALGGGWQIRLQDAKKRGQCILKPDPEISTLSSQAELEVLPVPETGPQPMKLEPAPKMGAPEESHLVAPAVLGVPQQVPAEMISAVEK